MYCFPVYNEPRLPRGLPVRVSTQAIRDRDFTHFHQNIQLCFVFSGELKHYINGIEYIQRPGTCAFVLPYMSHMLDSRESADTPIIAYVWFEESFLTERGFDFCSYGSDTAHFNGCEIPLICDFAEKKTEATSIFRSLINEFDLQEDMSCDRLATLIANIMQIACEKNRKGKPTKIFFRRLNNINRAISYIVENYPDKITTDDLCKIANMSRRNFTECFKTITRRTVKEFILSVRLFYASQKLFYGKLLFDDIAKECGLYNHSNLSRVFVKYLGVTPTQYVNQHYIDTSILHQIPLRERYKWLFDE